MERKWDDFHASHFRDSARRAWFNVQLRGDSAVKESLPDSHGPLTRESMEDSWTALVPGETEAQWRARHGLQYLTPEAAKIFDSSRRFRETRLRERAAGGIPNDDAPSGANIDQSRQDFQDEGLRAQEEQRELKQDVADDRASESTPR